MAEHYEDDHYEDDYYEDGPESDFSQFLQEQLQRTPWWLISLVFHAIIGFAATLIFIQEPRENVKIEFSASLIEEKVEEIKPEPKKDVFKKTKPVKQKEPVIENPVVKEAKVAEKQLSEDLADFEEAKGEQEAAANTPLKGKLSNRVMGIGGNLAGKFGTRSKGSRLNRLQEGGGGENTENAVKAGLIWLKFHQYKDGRWGKHNFTREDFSKDMEYDGGWEGVGESPFDSGVTSLALLAFLGYGNSTVDGDFAEQVKKAVRYLIKAQDSEGCVGPREGHYMYNHSIATMALCEAFAVSEYNPILKSAAEKAVDFLLKSQNPGLAWRYTSQSGDNDTSVTGWCIMALKSAKVAELEVPSKAFDGALAWIDSVTDDYYYRTGYMQKGDAGARPSGEANYAPLEAMTAAGMISRIYAGVDRKNPKLVGAAGLLLQKVPNWGKDIDGRSLVDFYYWYYGTLAMYQMGDNYWKSWNTKMKEALVTHQDEDGSWEIADPWSDAAGRVYSTATNVLSLEIYYRYARVNDQP